MTAGGSKLVQRLAEGFGAQGVSILVRLVQQLLMVPLFLRAWDATVYQDWLLLAAAISFLSLVDLGLRHYLGNLLLITWSKGEAMAFDRALRIGLAIYTGLILVALPLVSAAAWVVATRGWLAFGTATPNVILTVIVIMAVHALLAMPQGLIFSLYAARGDMARGVNLATASVALETLAVGAALWRGSPPVEVALIYLGTFAIFAAVVRIDLGRRYRDLRFGPIRPTIVEALGSISRAIDYVVIPLAQAAVLNGTVLILGVMAGASAAPVVAFTTMRTLANVVRQIVNQAAQVTSTELTRLHAAGDRPRVARLYAASARFLGGAGGLLAGAVLAVAPDFLTIWTRGKVAYDAWAFAGLLGAIMLALPGHIAMVLLYTSNQPRALSKATVAFGLIGMVGAVPAAHWAGLAGVAWVLAAAELATIGLLPWQVARAMGLPALRPAMVAWGAATVGFAIGFGVAFVELMFMSEKNLNTLVIVGIFWCGIVTLPACFLLLDGEGRRQVLGRIRGE